MVPAGVGFSIPTPVNTLHPVLTTSALLERQLYSLMYRPMFWIDPQHRIDWNESLASSVEVADGGATFRVTLKPYRWSDGAPVTADDVRYCWEMIRDLGPRFANFQTGGIPQMVRDVVVTGPNTLEFRLTRAVNPDWFEISGLGLLYALPRHAWGHLSISQQQGLQSTTSFYDVVDGPFRLERLAVGRYATFLPNPSYSGHQPGIRRLVVTFLQGADPLAELQAGQIDMANLPFSVWDAARGLTGFDTVSVGPIAAYTTLLPNLASPAASFLAEVGVRQAIAMAIDQQEIIRVVFHGSALPNPGFVPEALTDSLSPAIRSGRTPVDYDPAKAARQLEQSGWLAGPDGVRRKNGKRLAFEVLTTAGAATGLTMLQVIKKDLAAVGIELQIREAEFNQLLARMAGPANGWQTAFLSWSQPGYPDGTQFFRGGSSSNYEHYSSKTMDGLLDASVYEPGTAGLFALEDYVVSQQPMIFLPDGFATVLVRPGIDGVRKFISPSGTWSPEYLTLHGAMACH